MHTLNYMIITANASGQLAGRLDGDIKCQVIKLVFTSQNKTAKCFDWCLKVKLLLCKLCTCYTFNETST